MIKELEILKLASTPESYARAFKEYCEDKIRIWNELMEIVRNFIADQDVDQSTDIADWITSKTSILPTTWIPFEKGRVELQSYLAALRYQTESESEEWLEKPVLAVHSISGSGYSLMSVAESLDFLESSLQSIVSLAAGAGAMCFDSITDRLSYFRDYLSRSFTNPSKALSGTMESVTSIIERASNPFEFIQSIGSMMGVDTADVVEIGETDIYQFTGASPMGPLDFGSVYNTAAAVINTGVKVVKSVWSGLWSVGKKIFSSAASYVYKTAINPHDLEIIQTSVKTYVIDGFAHQGKQVSLTFSQFENVNLEDNQAEYAIADNAFTEAVSSNQWMKYSLTSGDVLFRPISVTYGSWSEYEYYEDEEASLPEIGYIRDVTMKADYILQPKATYVPDRDSLHGRLMSWVGIESWKLINYKTLLPNVVNSDFGSDELSLYNGFLDGLRVTLATLSMAADELRASKTLIGADLYLMSQMHQDRAFYSKTQDIALTNMFEAGPTVTNSDFVRISCGYNFQTDSYDTGIIRDSLGSLAFLYYYQVYSRKTNPLDCLFLPYEKTNASKTPGMFRVKTDADNYNAFNSFATKAIAIAVVAAVAITGFVFVKKAIFKLGLKQQAMTREVSNKILDGTATPADLRALKRLNRKSKMLGILGSNTTSGSSKMLSPESSNNDVLSVIV